MNPLLFATCASLPSATVRGRASCSGIAETFRRFALHALAVSLLVLSSALPSLATTTWTVTDTNDNATDTGSLRYTVNNAVSGDTINISVSGMITLDCTDPGYGPLVIGQNVTISGPGAANLAISGANTCQVFSVNPGVTASISGVTIENGFAPNSGGGINNSGTLTVSNSTLSGNSAYGNGGGINNSGTLTVSNSTLSGNSVPYYLIVFGSGIYNNGGTLTLTNSTLSGNSGAYYGGGIFNYGGTISVTNSTLSGNSGSYGGAIWNGGGGTLTLSNSTLSGNSAIYSGGGTYSGTNGGTITAKNSIVANSPGGGNCSNGISSQGFNLSDDATCSFNQTGDLNNTPAGLDSGGLQNNGGPTQTIAFLTGSSAIDAIPPDSCTDANGNLVIADQRGVPRPQGAGCDIGAYEFQTAYTPNLVANVCPSGQTTPTPCSLTFSLLFNIPAGTTLGATPAQVVTQGASGKDFSLVSGGGTTTCISGVVGPASCTVQATFAPVAPGVRLGAVTLTDNNRNLVANALISGLGQGPAIAFGPGTKTTVAGGLPNPTGVAVDAAGDVFIADATANAVYDVPFGGSQITVCGTGVPTCNGLSNPAGLAVDGAGDLFIADYGNNRVVEVPYLGNGNYGTQTTLNITVGGMGLSHPFGVAVDGAGDVFIADAGNNRVVEVPAGGDAQTTVGSGLSSPSGVAVDGAGDVFIADTNNRQVMEVPASGGAQTTVSNELGFPEGVAVDGAGDVFIADTRNNFVLEVPVGGAVGSGLNSPSGVAVDGAGDVFIADNGNNRVVEVQRSQPPSFSFASTPVGSTSSDSPQSVTIQNVGNQSLNAITPGLVVSGPNFLQVAGSGTPADCNSSFALTPGATCNLSISFEPQSVGNLTSTATFTDNALNTIPSASHSIALQGTGQAATVNVTVGTSPVGLAFSVDGTSYGSAQSFTWNIGSLHTIATTTPQTPVAGYQYTFTSWSDGGALSHSVPASGSTTSYTALFSTQYLLTTAASPTAGGTVSPLTGYQNAGLSVSLVASPATGYAFTNWTGSVANPGSASTTVTMSAPETVMANFAASAIPTTTTLMSSQNPSTYGQSVTFTTNVTSNNGTPNGNVNFKNGTTSLGRVKLVSGSASLTTSVLNAGSRTITAHYNGSTKYASSSSTALTQTVNKVATTTTVTNASLNPSTYSQPVTFTATVSTTAGSASGNVEFKWGALRLGSGPLSGGSASYTTTATQIPGGEDAITAVYNGDANHAASTSVVYTQTVNKEVTTTSLITSESPSTSGNPVMFTATVSSSAGTPAGNVAFTDGTTLLGTMALSGGTAQFTTSALAVGTHTIHAHYNGNGNYAVSSGQITQQVDP